MSEESNELNFNIPFRPVIDRSKDSEWYKANSKRLEDPEYRKKISDSLTGLKREDTSAYKKAGYTVEQLRDIGRIAAVITAVARVLTQ